MFTTAAAGIIALAGLLAAHRGWLDEADDDLVPDARQASRPSPAGQPFMLGLNRRRNRNSIYHIASDI